MLSSEPERNPSLTGDISRETTLYTVMSTLNIIGIDRCILLLMAFEVLEVLVVMK